MQATADPRPRTSIPAILVGVAILLTSGLGLAYSATSVVYAAQGAFEQLNEELKAPYFDQSFIVMSAICVTCYLALFVCGIDLVRSRLRSSRLVTLIMILEVVYFFGIASMWMHPTLGHSVAAATGVANGGLMLQFGILLPIWGPLVLWWARSRENAIVTTPHAVS